MKPHLLKAAINNLNESYSELKILFDDSESYLKTLKVPDGPVWKDSAHWRFHCVLEDVLAAKAILVRIHKILPPEDKIKEPDIKESLFNSVVAEQNLKIEKLNARLSVLEGTIEKVEAPKPQKQVKTPPKLPKKSKKSC